MATPAELQRRLLALDGRGYKAYTSILGEYQFSDFTLYVDHVQGDPFAAPSRLRVRVPQSEARFPTYLLAGRARQAALADFLARAFARGLREIMGGGQRGSGGSGRVEIDAGGQEILPRTACVVHPEYVEARISVRLPAAGRTCLGRVAIQILLNELPRVVRGALRYEALPPAPLKRHLAVAEDQEALRAALAPRRLVAFVADGAILPRERGTSDRPLRERNAVPFRAPEELAVELDTPNRGVIRGMGIPEGVTLIVGGGYHGKSTLLAALSRGVYNHIPGDGREYVVTRADAVKIRAEDGRRIAGVDISPFIANLPFGQPTAAFSSDNASGSTSQAANIVEALEVGTSLLLMDEDTCATNFMIRDERMQRLVPKAKEPITPFIDQVQNLYRDHGVSTILVIGGSGDYFSVANTVIWMDAYEPRVVTDLARTIARDDPALRLPEAPASFGEIVPRAPVPQSIDPYRGTRVKVGGRGLHTLQFGTATLDLDALEQLVDPSQTDAIGDMIVYALNRGYIDGVNSVREVVARVWADLERHGLDVISPFRGGHPGNYALPRPQEFAAALNRLPGLRVNQKRA